MYWATDWGLIRRHGHTLDSMLGISLSRVLIDFLMRLLFIALKRM